MTTTATERLVRLYKLRDRVVAEIVAEEARLGRIRSVALHHEDTRRRARRARLDAPEVRAWARRHGYPVGDRGRLPDDVLKAYDQWKAAR